MTQKSTERQSKGLQFAELIPCSAKIQSGEEGGAGTHPEPPREVSPEGQLRESGLLLLAIITMEMRHSSTSQQLGMRKSDVWCPGGSFPNFLPARGIQHPAPSTLRIDPAQGKAAE